MAAVDGLDYLSSSALEGLYQLDVTFRYGVDVDTAYQDTLAAFARAERDLPKDADPAIVIKADPSQLPVVQVAFESDRMDLTQLRTWIDNWLTDRLLAAKGVAGVDVAGGLEREIRVLIDHVALEKYGLSLSKIEQRLREENIALLGGRVTGANQETIVRTQGEYTDLESIRNILIARTADGRLRLRDIARVEDSHEEARLITRLDGRPAVKVNVIKQADANTVKTVEAVAARLAELAPAFPAGMQYALLENQADYIRSSIAGVRNTVVEAAVLVVLTFLVFLGSPRQVFIIAVVIPITLFANFFVMRLAGFSLNIFSLGGLVIAIGVMLDTGTIVLENITRLRAEHPDEPMAAIALRGTREVGGPIAASTLAFFALFLPFLLVPGMVTLLFRELVLIILSVIALSLLNAIFLVPMLVRRPPQARHGGAAGFQRAHQRHPAPTLWPFGGLGAAPSHGRHRHLPVFSCRGCRPVPPGRRGVPARRGRWPHHGQGPHAGRGGPGAARPRQPVHRGPGTGRPAGRLGLRHDRRGGARPLHQQDRQRGAGRHRAGRGRGT